MNLISKCDIPLEQFQSWAIKNKADEDFVFITIPSVYKISIEQGINPLFTIAQATKETGWGHFKGKVKKEFNNVCGLKKKDGERFAGAEQFATFETIDQGCRAFVEHICLYVGKEGYPLINAVDPRHFSNLFGKATTPLKLCKEWTGEDTYMEYYTRIMEMIEEIEETEIIAINPPHSQGNIEDDVDYKAKIKELEEEIKKYEEEKQTLKKKIKEVLDLIS